MLLHAGEVASRPKLTDQKPAPVVPAGPVDPDKNLPHDNDYIVHEWGTFTSFSGSDGITLDFRSLVGEDLPKFVLDRAQQAALNNRRTSASTALLLTKSVTPSRQRMETPVTYFYTDQERIVDVKVDFPNGLLTEFYPPVRQFGPDYKKDVPEPLSKSWLRWGKVRLIPEDLVDNKDGVDPYIPQISKGDNDHYAYARETDSAHIQVTDPLLRTTYREKFLFYRGLGNFELPVSVKSTGTGRFTLTNTGHAPIHYAFLVQVDGKHLRFARYDDIAGGMEMLLPRETATLDALSDEVARALMSDGLYRKEAYAMVKTWKSSWFGEQGTRVFYSLPQSNTDALLPLHLAPAPKELVRVMIGRLETLTPEQEQKIEDLVRHLGDNDPAVRDQTSAQIKAMGRFAEPALTHIAQISDDPEVQLRAAALLKQVLTTRGIRAGVTK
jgi:hypothetical protein